MTRLFSIGVAVLVVAPLLFVPAVGCKANQGSFDLKVRDWEEQIGHRNPNVRRRAAEQAQRLPLAKVRGLLWNVLKYDDDNETVGRAAATLGEMLRNEGAPSKSDVDALLIAFDRVGEFYARGRAAVALGRISDKLSPALIDRVIKTFIAWLDNVSGDAERYVAEALGMFGGRAKTAIPALEALRKRHKWEQTRTAATDAINVIKGASR